MQILFRVSCWVVSSHKIKCLILTKRMYVWCYTTFQRVSDSCLTTPTELLICCHSSVGTTWFRRGSGNSKSRTFPRAHWSTSDLKTQVWRNFLTEKIWREVTFYEWYYFFFYTIVVILCTGRLSLFDALPYYFPKFLQIFFSSKFQIIMAKHFLRQDHY